MRSNDNAVSHPIRDGTGRDNDVGGDASTAGHPRTTDAVAPDAPAPLEIIALREDAIVRVPIVYMVPGDERKEIIIDTFVLPWSREHAPADWREIDSIPAKGFLTLDESAAVAGVKPATVSSWMDDLIEARVRLQGWTVRLATIRYIRWLVSMGHKRTRAEVNAERDALRTSPDEVLQPGRRERDARRAILRRLGRGESTTASVPPTEPTVPRQTPTETLIAELVAEGASRDALLAHFAADIENERQLGIFI